jgi:hypothetical protein
MLGLQAVRPWRRKRRCRSRRRGVTWLVAWAAWAAAVMVA